jgi:hypothetical protein
MMMRSPVRAERAMLSLEHLRRRAHEGAPAESRPRLQMSPGQAIGASSARTTMPTALARISSG